MVGNRAFSFARNRGLYPLLDDGHMLCEEADIGEALLTDDGGDIGLFGDIACIFDTFKGNDVPLTLGQREVAVQFQVNGMIASHLRK